jgi:hypothetical protein
MPPPRNELRSDVGVDRKGVATFWRELFDLQGECIAMDTEIEAVAGIGL